MASLLNPESVLLTCSCSALSPLTRLYFCRHCVKLRCPLCVSHEVGCENHHVLVANFVQIYHAWISLKLNYLFKLLKRVQLRRGIYFREKTDIHNLSLTTRLTRIIVQIA